MKIRIFTFCILAIAFACCKNQDKNKIASAKVHEVYSEVNYTDSLIDQSQIDIFYSAIAADSFLVRNVNSFYNERDRQMAWSVDGELTDAADNLYERIMEHMYVTRDSQLVFLRLHDTWETPLRTTPKGMNTPVFIDLLLTASYFKYAEHTYSGSAKNLALLEWYIPRKKRNYVGMLDALIAGEAGEEPLQNNNYYQRLKDNLIKYRKIEDAGGWPEIPPEVVNLKLNDTSDALIPLRKYLFITGDLANGDTTSTLFDSFISDAISSFQQRHGKHKTGAPDKETIAEMNVPVGNRIKQILLNMERLRWIAIPDSVTDFLLVNIPDYELHAYENGKLIWDMKVVVGTTANRTTAFYGNITQVVLNPYWNIPKSIVTNEMLPRLEENPNEYIESQNMEVISNGEKIKPSEINWSDPDEVNDVRIRQCPGPGNALGKYKFLFPNSFSIYLHDTPSKHLFDKEERSFSHGCIRVDEPEKLANYLLRDDPEWSAEKVADAVADGKEKFINLKKPLPVYIVYFTAWVNEEGKLNFRDDIYNHDLKLEREIFVSSKSVSEQ